MEQNELIDQHDYGREVPPCSRKDLILHAYTIHQALGYEGDCAFPILEFVELVFPKIYEGFDLQILTEAEMGDDFGLTFPDQHIIKLREDVYDAAYAGQGFGRMIVGHECSHQLRHENIPMSLACRKASRNIPSFKSSEWQANAMAGALLMPASKILNMTVYEIVDRYKVTPTAAKMQLKKIGEEAKRWKIPVL